MEAFLKKDLSPLEVEDLTKAKTDLEEYKKLYDFMSYAEDLSIYALGIFKGMNINQPIASRLWRFTPGLGSNLMLDQINTLFGAYYSLMDDANEASIAWKEKVCNFIYYYYY